MNGIHPLIRRILNNRGITDEDKILEILSDKPNRTYDPFLLKNMHAGVDLLLFSIKQNRRICIYGDYDADGVTSVSLLMQVLSHLTTNLFYYIPSRFDEGYGLNKDAIDLIRGDGAELIITVDCGSVSYDEVEYGKSIGIDFIITDHHNINERPADCILINPKQPDCPYPFKHLAGCGVAFKLAQGIQRKTGLPKSIISGVLDLVAIATIGDIVPLIDENRTLTKYGMRRINGRKRPGLKRLLEAAEIPSGEINSENIAYIIVPHLNAAGRLQDAKTGVELLISEDMNVIDKNAAILVQNNTERKMIQEKAFKKCKEIVDAEMKADLFCVINPKNIHEGIAGIVAGKIKDEFGKPTIILTESGQEGYLKGTGRSFGRLNIYESLKKYESFFSKFGGHSGACGFMMKSEYLDELRRSLNHDIEILYRENPCLFDTDTPIDLTLEVEEIDLNLASQLEKLAPFGCQNERPLLQITALKTTHINYMGENSQHVRFFCLGKSGKRISCVFFQKAQDYGDILQQNDELLNILGYANINTWNGDKKIQFVIKSITC
ncbi:MAG: single-stranded-DNA-specific exonuclease RecJ [Eubacteriales bacterium]|nr:single-stranded-DNA-specific exonuclease RecJ [Eubacteriales bacterium]